MLDGSWEVFDPHLELPNVLRPSSLIQAQICAEVSDTPALAHKAQLCGHHQR